MSKENVALFSKAINKDSKLNARISQAEPTVEAWVRIAHDAGFEFTAEEFADVVGNTLGRNVTVANAVKEYLGTRYTVGDAQLSERALDAVVGGRMQASTGI
jgi:predicted ribosomally synthesized peptide with nif11-like leader